MSIVSCVRFDRFAGYHSIINKSIMIATGSRWTVVAMFSVSGVDRVTQQLVARGLVSACQFDQYSDSDCRQGEIMSQIPAN